MLSRAIPARQVTSATRRRRTATAMANHTMAPTYPRSAGAVPGFGDCRPTPRGAGW
ncbi:MAG: hypothetical protein U5R31_13680 [Acidimicrobiia bacterium]|nr:hypothetical protein [Acidimicrobiia bacterium]